MLFLFNNLWVIKELALTENEKNAIELLKCVSIIHVIKLSVESVEFLGKESILYSLLHLCLRWAVRLPSAGWVIVFLCMPPNQMLSAGKYCSSGLHAAEIYSSVIQKSQSLHWLMSFPTFHVGDVFASGKKSSI